MLIRFWEGQDLNERAKSLESILPELKILQHSANAAKPSVKMYAGASEIKKIFEDILETKMHFSGIVAWRDLVAVLGDEFINDFFKTQAEHFLKVRLVTPDNETTRILQSLDGGHLRETRFFPDPVPLNTANFMYGNKLAIISLNSSLPTAFLIEDPDVHNTMQHLFEKMWTEGK